MTKKLRSANRRLSLLLSVGLAIAVADADGTVQQTFGDDIEFLRAHTDVIVLSDKDGSSLVALAPAWQGRVMTSSAEGSAGRSFGWINRTLISSGKQTPHINVFGGEDRFWLGPEGGQFSIYFSKGAPFDLEHWFVPAPLDTMPFKTVSQSETSARFQAEFRLTNFTGTQFQVRVDREVRLLSRNEAWTELGLSPVDRVSMVAYESVNVLSNAGKLPWRKETGLLSIWILGMFRPTTSSAIVVPIKAGADSLLGPKVTSDYFGDVPPDRLKVTDEAVYLRGDGQFRSKIGINPRRSRGILGSYDPEHRVLTIVKFSQPEGVNDYVNSRWALQKDPYAGDVANSYNDGPPAPGVAPLGPFFEMESSSPAAALAPRERLTHTHRTFHLTGPEQELDSVARSLLGASLASVDTIFER